MDQGTAFEIVKKYIDFLKVNKYDIQKAFIFGSYVNEKFHEDSDIDLAIVFKNLSNSFTMQIQLMKLSRKFDTRIEPHPFDESDFDSSNPFAKEILTKGIQIA
jgi:predicted nucleotidyltransferase